MKHTVQSSENPMRPVAPWLQRRIAIGLAVLFALPLGGVPACFAQQATPSQQSSPDQSSSDQAGESVSSSATPQAAAGSATDTNSAQPSSLPQEPAAQGPAAQQSATPEQKKDSSPAPVGTAVAPYEKGVGVAASRPAGAVIAPAKQKRTRSFLIKSGLLIGAGVAVGSVVALSNASPSRPH